MSTGYLAPNEKRIQRAFERLSDIRVFSNTAIAVDVLFTLYTLGVIAYVFFVFPSFTVRHTKFDPSFPVPGTLVSDRYGFEWFALALPILFIFLPIFSHFLISCPHRFGFMIVYLLLSVVILVANAISFFYLVGLFATCNADLPNNRYNLCNDPLYCCVRFDSPETGCTTFASCAPADTKLKADPIFLTALWLQLSFLILGFASVALGVYAVVANLTASMKRLSYQGVYPSLSVLNQIGKKVQGDIEKWSKSDGTHKQHSKRLSRYNNNAMSDIILKNLEAFGQMIQRKFNVEAYKSS